MLPLAQHARRLMHDVGCVSLTVSRDERINIRGCCFLRNLNRGHWCLLKRSQSTTLTSMSNNNEERSRYKITDSHRNQAIIATVRKDRDTYAWTWQGHIEFTDGQHFEFSSQRTFSTASEAEDYMRRFACARIDSQLSQ